MIVAITGASGGLGAALAIELGRRGHAVGLMARRSSELEGVSASVRAAGGTAAVRAVDVTDRSAVLAAVRALETELGPIDIAVANAGAGRPTPARKLNAEHVAAIFRLNVDGAVNLFEATLPGMLARGRGQLVGVSSIAAWRGLPPSGAYSASKAALDVLMEAWACELQGTGVCITGIHPGFVRTPLTDVNKFAMPFLMEADDAGRRMADGILARRREVNFPLPMVALMRAVHWMPGFLYERLAARLVPSDMTEP